MRLARFFLLGACAIAAGCATMSANHAQSSSASSPEETRGSSPQEASRCPEGATKTGWWPAPAEEFGDGALEQGCLLKLDEWKRARHGEWRVRGSEGAMLATFSWERGTRQGSAVWFHASGKRRLEGGYQAGRRHGAFRWWTEAGALEREAAFADDFEQVDFDCAPGSRLMARDESLLSGCLDAEGELTGEVVRWHPNGFKKSQHTASKGRVAGRARTWSEAGVLTQDCTFDEERGTGSCLRSWSSGVRREQESLVERERDGAYRLWHENGAPAYEGDFKAGLPVGVHREFDAEGQVLEERRFDASGRLLEAKLTCQRWISLLGSELEDAPYGLEDIALREESWKRFLTDADPALPAGYELALEETEGRLHIVARGRAGTQLDGGLWRFPLDSRELEAVNPVCADLSAKAE